MVKSNYRANKNVQGHHKNLARVTHPFNFVKIKFASSIINCLVPTRAGPVWPGAGEDQETQA